MVYVDVLGRPAVTVQFPVLAAELESPPPPQEINKLVRKQKTDNFHILFKVFIVPFLGMQMAQDTGIHFLCLNKN